MAVEFVKYKSLMLPGNKSAGRAGGKIVVRHRDGGRVGRICADKAQGVRSAPGQVVSIFRDSYRSGFVARVVFFNGLVGYIGGSEGLAVGDFILNVDGWDISYLQLGNGFSLGELPPGVMIHGLELRPGGGESMIRSAGAFGTVLGKSVGGDYVVVELPSKERRLVCAPCRARVGKVSNEKHMFYFCGKAGVSRSRGKRPHVRGVAMNPVDHPHGGGEGKTSGGRHPVSPWGLLAKGKKTRGSINRFVVK